MANKTVGRQVANLLDNYGFSCLTELGYDAAKGEYVDMEKAGILDTLKVTRTVLVDAARRNMHSSLLTTTEAVSELPKDGIESAGDMEAMDYLITKISVFSPITILT